MSVNIPQFRYMSDYEDFIKSIRGDINELVELARQQKKLLASSLSAVTPIALTAAATDAITINLLEKDKTAAARKRRLGKSMDKELVKVVVPDRKTLEKRYAIAEELHEKYRALESVEGQVRARFQGPGSKKFRDELEALKGNVEHALNEALNFISEIASKHVPKSFEKYMDAVSAEIDEHIVFDSSEVYLYVSVTALGSLVFTYYKMMNNAVDEGGIVHTLYATVQWVVGNDTEHSQVFVYLDHEFEPPNVLLNQGHGEPVSSAQEAVKAIGDLLRLEHFTSELGVVPLSLAFLRDPSSIDKRLFAVGDLISAFTVDGTKMIFKVKSAVPKKDYPKIASELYIDVKQLLKKKRGARIRMQPNPGQREIAFDVISSAGPFDIAYQDAEFMKDKFNIDDKQLRRILHIMNQS